jgi:hypothetical protein
LWEKSFVTVRTSSQQVLQYILALIYKVLVLKKFQSECRAKEHVFKDTADPKLGKTLGGINTVGRRQKYLAKTNREGIPKFFPMCTS